MKVLLINGSETDASSFYRSTGPYSRLKDVEVIHCKEINWHVILPADVVVVNRPHTQNMVSLCQYVKTCKKPLLLDWDDSMYSIPETNPAYDKLMNPIAQACVNACIKLADAIIVSTPSIGSEILERFPGKKVVVVPNAVDTEFLDLTPIQYKRNKIVVLRGGGSHDSDLEEYKDAILKLINDYPEYKWAFMGMCPRWVVDSGISDDRLMIFQYMDLMKYFETLIDLKPEIMIVPLQNNKFNEGKSAIALYEGVVAGAAVLATNLLEFDKYAACTFDTQQDLLDMFSDFASDEEIRDYYYHTANSLIPRLFEMNAIREKVLKDVIYDTAISDFRKHSTKNTQTLIPATDQEFFNVCLTHGHIQENKSYEEMHRKTVNWLIDKLDPFNVVEFGSGPGATIEYFNDRGVAAMGLESNPKFIEYWDKRNPHMSSNMMNLDFIKDPVEFDEPVDLGISIEVFEHIKQSEEDWDKFITSLSKQFKHFFFTSTPFRDKPSQDLFWGHINIRTTTSWIKLFERNGWELVEKPKVLTAWDLLFVSKNVPKVASLTDHGPNGMSSKV
jgi:hypothetical protein